MSQPASNDKPQAQNSVESSAVLAGFSASEQIAILHLAGNNPTPESIRAIPEIQWRKLLNIGDRFIVKLMQRGWLGECVNRTRREPLSAKEIQRRRNAARQKKLKAMIDRARRQIHEWEREAARANH